jgi:hypothetical protein
MRDLFNSIDTDGSGTITHEEMMKVKLWSRLLRTSAMSTSERLALPNLNSLPLPIAGTEVGSVELVRLRGVAAAGTAGSHASGRV